MFIRKTAVVATLAALGMTAVSANASHIFSTNITVEGIALAAGNAFTNPTITVATGTPIDFSFDLFSVFGDSDTFFVSLSGAPFLSNTSSPYNGTGTQATPVNFSFAQLAGALGTYPVSLIPNFPVSFPDYLFPGGASASQPTIPFTLVVNAATGVPEPASVALLGLGLAALGFSRRRK